MTTSRTENRPLNNKATGLFLYQRKHSTKMIGRQFKLRLGALAKQGSFVEIDFKKWQSSGLAKLPQQHGGSKFQSHFFIAGRGRHKQPLVRRRYDSLGIKPIAEIFLLLLWFAEGCFQFIIQ